MAFRCQITSLKSAKHLEVGEMKVQMKERKSGKLVWIEAENIVAVGSYKNRVFVETIDEKSYFVNFEQPLSPKDWINAIEILGELMSGLTPEEFENKEIVSYDELVNAIKTSDRWMTSYWMYHFPLRHRLKLRAEAKLRKLHKNIIIQLQNI